MANIPFYYPPPPTKDNENSGFLTAGELYDPYNPPKMTPSGAYTSEPSSFIGQDLPGTFKNRPILRRYSSAEWWAHSWDKKVARKLLPRIIYVIVGFVLMGIWIGVMFTFADKETKHQKANAAGDVRRSEFAVPGIMMLKGSLRKFDPDERVLTVQWSSGFLEDGKDGLQEMGTNNETTVAMALYRDVYAIFDAEVNQTTDGEFPFRVDNTSAPRLGILGSHTWDSVDTDIDMMAASSNDVWKEPQFGYPWDEWSGDIVLIQTYVLLEQALNRTGVGADIFPGITLADHIINWKIEGRGSISAPCRNGSLSIDERTCALEIHFTARRPGIVIFCVIVVVIVNWLSTIAIFLVTGEAILLRRVHILEGTDILGVCFSALFALPSVRSLLPGAPSEFGAVIDLIGILPNVIIISLCTTMFCAAKLNLRLQQSLTGDKDA